MPSMAHAASQAEALARFGAAPDKVVFLDAPRAVLMERVQRRRMILASTQGDLQCSSQFNSKKVCASGVHYHSMSKTLGSTQSRAELPEQTVSCLLTAGWEPMGICRIHRLPCTWGMLHVVCQTARRAGEQRGPAAARTSCWRGWTLGTACMGVSQD